jgi:Protein of unknown function (DUF1691)
VSFIQRLSSVVFSIFVILHLANTAIIPLVLGSVSASEPYLLLTRKFYQNPVLEIVLVALPLVAHVASGISLRLIRRSQNLERHVRAGTEQQGDEILPSKPSTRRIWPPLSYISLAGYALAIFMIPHLQLFRVLPLFVEDTSSAISLEYVGHFFSRQPGLASVLYIPLIVSSSFHVVWGWSKWLGLAPRTYSPANPAQLGGRRRIFWRLHAVAVLLGMVWAAGGLGILSGGGAVPGPRGEYYDRLLAAAGLEEQVQPRT